MIKEIKIDYDLDVFLKADYSVHKGSCISHQVNELQDIHETYGWSNTYNSNNTIIRQLWFDKSQVDYVVLGQQLNMEVLTVSSILQPPGNTIPIQRDTFYQINKKFPQDERLKIRANIYLKDWKVGEILQYEKNKQWYNSTHWSAGDGFIWDSSHLHLSANNGMQNKYTLQVSGFLNES